MHFLSKLLISTMIMLIALPGFAVGAESSTHVETKDKKSKPITLDTLVISATRTEISAFEAPASVSVVDQEQIEQEQATSLRDLLENEPNVDFSSGTSTYYQVPSLRGLDDEQTILKIDGAKQQYNDNAGNAKNPIVIDPNLLKKVEIVRGPSSTLHGAGGIGGVIAMRTKDAKDLLKPGQKYGLQIKGGHQTADSQEWMSTSAFAGNETFGILANLTTRDFGHMRTSNPKGTRTTYRTGESTTQFVKGSYSPTKGQDMSLSLNQFHDHYRFKSGSYYKSKQSQITANYALHPENNQWVDLHAVGQYVYRFNKNYAQGGPYTTFDDTMTSWGVDIQNTFRFGIENSFSHSLTVGTDYYTNSQKGNHDGVADESRPDATGYDFGLFMQDNIMLPFGFSFIPAVRYTQYHREEASGRWDKQHQSQFSPKATLNWQATDWLNVFGTYAESFRPPSLNEIYFHMNWPMWGEVRPNPKLKPETAKTWELGTGLSFNSIFSESDPLRFKVVYFKESIKDFQEPKIITFAPPNSIATTVNVGKVHRYGYEAELHYSYERYAMSLSYAKVVGYNAETHARVGQTPAQVGLRLSCDLPEYDLNFTWKSIYTAHSKGYNPASNSTKTVSDYHIHGLSVVWTPQDLQGYSGLRVDFGVDNLFDTRYTTYRGGIDRGRNVKIGLSCTF